MSIRFNADEVLAMAIKTEENGAAFYRKAAVFDDVAAAREIEHAMFGNGLPNGGCVVSGAVAGDAEGLDVRPNARGRQRANGRGQWLRHRAQGRRLVDGGAAVLTDS